MFLAITSSLAKQYFDYKSIRMINLVEKIIFVDLEHIKDLKTTYIRRLRQIRRPTGMPHQSLFG